MKSTLSVLLGALIPCALLVGACGDDVIDADDIIDQDSGNRQDATPLPPPRDGGPDASRADASPDGGDAEDGGDGGETDADAGPVVDPAIAVFVNALGAAACTSYDTCCAGRLDPSVTPATPSCLESVATDDRFFGSLLNAYYLTPEVAASTRVTIDATAAAACLTAVGELGCILDGVPAANWKAVLQQCSAALSGTGIAGDSCYSDLECGRELSCIGVTAPGVQGVCTTLRAAGESFQNSAQYGGDSCSYRGYGFGTGLRLGRVVDGGAIVCSPQRALGERCQPFTPADDYDGTDVDCASYACGFNDEGTEAICVDTKSDFSYCAQYRIDAP